MDGIQVSRYGRGERPDRYGTQPGVPGAELPEHAQTNTASSSRDIATDARVKPVPRCDRMSSTVCVRPAIGPRCRLAQTASPRLTRAAMVSGRPKNAAKKPCHNTAITGASKLSTFGSNHKRDSHRAGSFSLTDKNVAGVLRSSRNRDVMNGRWPQLRRSSARHLRSTKPNEGPLLGCCLRGDACHPVLHRSRGDLAGRSDHAARPGTDQYADGRHLLGFAVAYAIFEIPGGWMGDWMGARKVLMRIVIWWSAFTALTGLMWNFGALYVCRFLFGAGEAGLLPQPDEGVHFLAAHRERVRVQGIMWMAARWGGAITPPAGSVSRLPTSRGERHLSSTAH